MGQRRPINPAWVGCQLGKALAKDAIIVNNGTLRVYPGRDVPGTFIKSGGSAGGYVAVATGNYTGGLFDPPPHFAKLAEAANCCGENVSDPDEVGPALTRTMAQVRNGTPAVVAVQLPTIPEEMAMGGDQRGDG